jgi:hypothetical protein
MEKNKDREPSISLLQFDLNNPVHEAIYKILQSLSIDPVSGIGKLKQLNDLLILIEALNSMFLELNRLELAKLTKDGK